MVTGSVSALAELPAAVPDLFAKDRASTAAGNVSSVVGAARDTGEAVAANVGWQYKVSLRPAAHRVAEHLRRGCSTCCRCCRWTAATSRWCSGKWSAGGSPGCVHRPDPGLVDYRKLIPVSFGIFVVLVAFGTLLILADIVNPVNIG